MIKALNNVTPWADRLMRYNDILLAVMVVAVIALMILPLPPMVVDSLIAANLCIAVALMMVALYIPSPVTLSTLPSLLLFTTLYRLALNITTTRQILLHAHAGKIIDTFGHLVVGGNFIVGVVVFMIITIVQFIVIAKGSERVAEVGARFSLDGMPGKQMSIDADLRAGLIDITDARQRRTELEKESQLYGAMDGAMKFVKGDAIASLIITVINILGGLAIGIFQKGMGASDALVRYSILTVGDGLVSQIPALFISVTAGIVVTRVSSGEHPNLGGEIGAQILGQPKALRLAGILLFCFSMIPGFPKAQFVVIGIVLSTVSFIFAKKIAADKALDRDDLPALGAAADTTRPERKKIADQEFVLTVPLMLEIDESIKTETDAKVLNLELLKIRQALYMDLGVPFPGINLKFSKSKEEGSYTIFMEEIPLSEGQIKKGHYFMRESNADLEILQIPFEDGAAFLPRLHTVWVDKAHHDKLIELDLNFMDVPQILSYHLSYILKNNASNFIGLQETKYLIDRMEAKYPELVKEVQRVLPVNKVAEVLQRLVMEEISIRNLRTIFQNMVEWGQKEKDVVLLTEYIRIGLSRYISNKYGSGMNMLPVYLLDPEVEEHVRNAIRQTSAGSYLALGPDEGRELIEKIKLSIGDLEEVTHKPVLLTSMDVRRYLKKLIEADMPDLAVLSHQEMAANINIQPLGRITL